MTNSVEEKIHYWKGKLSKKWKKNSLHRFNITSLNQSFLPLFGQSLDALSKSIVTDQEKIQIQSLLSSNNLSERKSKDDIVLPPDKHIEIDKLNLDFDPKLFQKNVKRKEALKVIRSCYHFEETQEILKKIESSAQYHILKNGIKTLYMSLGTIWFADEQSHKDQTSTASSEINNDSGVKDNLDDSTQTAASHAEASTTGTTSLEEPQKKKSKRTPFRTPLILIPIHIESVNNSFFFQYDGLEILFNPLLKNQLEQEYGIDFFAFEKLLNNEFFEINVVMQRMHELLSTHLKEKGWFIRNEAVIGIFDHTDLNFHQDLSLFKSNFLGNSLVQKLSESSAEQVDPGQRWEKFEELAKRNDAHVLEQLNTILDADSSQLNAIHTAQKETSFVLQGPPGTGKSQTVTNIISDFLSRKKTVLFLSEKIRALDIVRNNLENAELGDHILDLYKNELTNIEFISLLDSALDRKFTPSTSLQQNNSKELIEKEKLINDFLQESHQDRSEMSLTYNQVIGLIDNVSYIEHTHDVYPNPFKISVKQFDDAQDILSNYYDAYSRTKYLDDAINEDIRTENFDENSKEKLKSLLLKLDNIFTEVFQPLSNKLINYFGFDLDPSFDTLLLISEIVNDLDAIPILPSGWSEIEKLEQYSSIVARFKKKQVELKKQSELILSKFRTTHVDDNEINYFIDILERYKNNPLRDTPLMYKDYKAVKSHLQKIRVSDHFVPQTIIGQLKFIQKHKNDTKHFIDSLSKAEPIFGEIADPIYADLDVYLKYIDIVLDFFKSYPNLISNRKVRELISSSRDEIRKTVEQCDDIMLRYTHLVQDIVLLLSFSNEQLLQQKLMGGTPEQILENIALLAKNIDNIQDISKLNKHNRLIKEEGLGEYVERFQDQYDQKAFVDCYKKSFYQQWLETAKKESPILGRIDASNFSEVIQEFIKMDQDFIKIGPERVKNSIRKIFSSTERLRGDITIIKREVIKKKGKKSIKQLFSEIPNLIQHLKQIMIMTPAMMVEYVNPTKMQFDLVIFDEASLIEAQNAIGAFIRGKQIIIVGDSQQLSPLVREQENEESTNVKSSDSILDLCANSMKNIMLKTHYRSYHEDLIAFSNQYFYKNKLLSFPSPIVEDEFVGVKYYYVHDGTLDKGFSSNRSEANALLNRMEEIVLQNNQLSIGIITFSEDQKLLIERLLHEKITKDPTLKNKLEGRTDEPVFIKCIDQVQGDERDVILLSLTYGKTENGSISRDFGFLTENNGERYFNVSITRSRKLNELFCSFYPTDYKLDEDSKKGFSYLLKYLEFAIQGPAYLGIEQFFDIEGESIGKFEQTVAQALQLNGLDVRPYIGYSNVKIDLAIVHPNDPFQFILGIDCFSENSLGIKSARDRLRIKNDLLLRQGWNLYSISPFDWANRKQTILNEIQQKVEHLTKNFQHLPNASGKKGR